MSAAAPAGPSALARLWRLWPYARADRGLLVGAAACMLLLGAATGAYAYLSGPALRFLLTGGEQGLSGLARVLPGLAHMDRERWRWLLPALIVAIAALKGLAYCGQFFSMGLFGHRVGLSLRRALFSRLCDLSPIQLTAQRQGDLLSRLSADVAAVETAANYAVGTYMRDGVQVVVLVGVALALEWRIALVAIVLVPLAVLPASRLTKSFLRRTREAQATLGVMAAQVQEGVQGIRTLQAFDAREAELARFDAQARVQLRAQQKANWARAAVPGLMELFAAVAISFAFLAAYGAKGDAAERFVSLLYALVLLYQPAKQLGRVGQMALAAAVSTERLLQLLELPRWVEDPPSPAPLPRLARGIELKDVAYSYGDRPALRGVSLTLPVGKVTALVGPSGSGKSTLTALLLRQARPSRGEILVDGVDVERAAVDAVRAQFALVTQEPLLFAATVRENLLLARPGASETELRRAAALAQADGFLSALPKGYDTPLGERGVRLSGGQKQRLALARALLADAPVLILDEATSSLDPESEREVQAALAAVLPGRTALVIAHRLSTVADADVVHVLQEGRVVESGTRTALLQQGGLFAQLWRLQHAGAA